ncbi:MAG TPA: arsenate reductase ArsC [Pyrinomonadaceae bacterium]|nr:arsenate reductase ArsC [Pyrinomonadaceae bacterium]
MSNPYKVLFLCTGNSARSILGEYLLRQIGGSQFVTFSAGSFPTGKVNPFAVEVLKETYKIDASGARSKSWEEFEGTAFDYVITVCDNAREACPIWPGQPVVAHWGLTDPAATKGSDEDIRRAFQTTASELRRRIELFTALPLDRMDQSSLVQSVNEIGRDHELER